MPTETQSAIQMLLLLREVHTCMVELNYSESTIENAQNAQNSFLFVARWIPLFLGIEHFVVVRWHLVVVAVVVNWNIYPV